MGQPLSQKRPWLAALLAALATGLGHLYLRRWRRAVGWLAASFVTTALFVDPAAFDAFVAGSWGLETLVAIAPMFFVIGLSIVDAYLLARMQTDGAVADSVDGSDTDSVACPHCGNELDPDLEFCHWCTNPVEGIDRDRPDAADEER
ncbi:zinc ribbon domain-containing protein [Natrinema versiforme]|uniref:Zinc ribbon domain-containing protein n=1 Tax=Natrinema versiforme TaxID=88724 RepID=A0A4P8WNC5_9EURY|nr:zinc ribbon domain-containing protein [Natrinema versiforme]QCS44875.1 zinc ribbon domain-containing protein [Natrinema versiforme]